MHYNSMYTSPTWANISIIHEYVQYFYLTVIIKYHEMRK